MEKQMKIDQNTLEQIRPFMDGMPGGFFIYHADGAEELIYANQAMLRIFACDTMEEFKELTGNSFRGIVHPDDLDEIELSIKEQIAHNQYDMDYVEYRIIRKDGEIRWIEDYGHFVRSESMGDIFYVFVGDATEKNQRNQKEKEQLIQEQLRRLDVIEGLSIDYESIFYADLDKNRIKAYRVSSRFAKTFPEEHMMREFTGFDADYIREWVYPDDRELVKGISNPDFLRRKLSEDKAFHISYRIYRNGKVTYIQLRIVNVGSEERISQIVMGYRNIDDEIIQEMQQKRVLAAALNEATLANKAKNLFLSNMSHDIRTPMNAIVGFTSLIRKHIRDEEKVNSYLDMISVSSDQLLQLLNDVLEISKLESENVHVEETECSLMDIAHQVQMNMIAKAAAKNITFSLDISNLKHDMVFTDRAKLTQLLTYLVDNAVKYTREGGWVTIVVMEAQKESEQSSHVTYQFIVEDSGIGISEAFLEHIFEPFEREKNTTHSGIHGTGLGLTITRKLVEMIGGTIDVTSVVGRGSKFIVTLPLYMRAESSNVNDFGDEPIGFSRPKRILIVDDNEINLEIENEVLKDAGFLVDTADDGSIAVEKVKHSKPGDYDLILMDIQMPIMDGYHATRAIRAMEDAKLSGIPIIAVSANSFEEDRKRALESGMNAHLPKPLDTHHLYKVIRQFLKEDKRIVSLEKVEVRPIKREEYLYLNDFLYDALYVAQGQKMPSRDIIEQPGLAIYIEDFGGVDDLCLVAEFEGHLIGAAWTRILDGDVKGYGNISGSVPEFAISVKKNYRRQGIGTKLMKAMIVLLKARGYEKVSLSVNKDNYAYRLYRRLGFQVVKVREEDYLMVLELK
ncbi:MAG: GNAT family N-acetyltransferase [Bacillus sp. (in: Bacteria)]|nr:GNAT family N-acetyltransferase [Bacillus sp. (in: firmicutes)]MCM1427596.1 GNAT family N-acetyltransferase [Eubacterium sp.]